MSRAAPRFGQPGDSEPASPPRGEEMSPLFMDSGYEPNSPGSLSAEDSQSNTPGSEREGDGPQMGKRGSKRQEKNRDAARKSRKKQTERADELHEELQGLERSNSALQKEIAALKKEFQLYTTALERHKPSCCLQDSAPSPSSSSVSPPADCQAVSSPPRGPSQASASTSAAAPSLSTSSASSLTLQTLDRAGSTHLSSSTPAPTAPTLASSSKAFTSPRFMSVPYSASFSTALAPHSLFSSDTSSIIASGPTNVTPVCAGLISHPVSSSSPATAAQSQSRQDAIHKPSSMSANACFSAFHPGALEDLLMKDTPFLTASSNVVPPPPYNHLAAKNAGLGAHGTPVDVAQPRSGHFRGNPINSTPPSSLLPSILQDPALQSSYGGHIAPSPSSLLSLLTVPSPLSVSQTTSSSFDGPLPQPTPSLPPSGDSLRDLTLYELLESNDWILQ